MVFILDAKLTNGSSTSSSGEDNKEEESESDSEEEKEQLKHQSSSVGQYDMNTEYTTYITIHNNIIPVHTQYSNALKFYGYVLLTKYSLTVLISVPGLFYGKVSFSPLASHI